MTTQRRDCDHWEAGQWPDPHRRDDESRSGRGLVLYLLVSAVVLGLVALWGTPAHAQIVAPTRVSTFDWQCQDASGQKLSDHQRVELAFVACLNNPAGAFVQGGRYRVNRGTTTPPATCAPPAPADLTQQGTCPAGTTGSWPQTKTHTCVGTTWTPAATWTPSTPPSGACTVTPPVPTTPTAVLICTGNAPFNQQFAACTTASLGQPTNAQAVLYCSDSVTQGAARESCPSAVWYNWGGIQSFSVVLTNAGWYPRSAVQGVAQPLTAPLLTSTRTANATNPANSNVTLTWAAVPGATAGYDVERCSGPTCVNFTALAAVSGLTYANTNLPGGLTLRYRVRGADAAGKGPYSNIETVVTPTAPTATAALSWTPPTTNTDGTTLTNLSGYRIEYSEVFPAGPTFGRSIVLANPGLVTYVVVGLSPGNWAFRLVAVTPNADSMPSNVVTKQVLP